MHAMKIVIPGGSGQIGAILSRAFSAGEHEVVVLSRQGASDETRWRVLGWDGETIGPWAAELEGADAVINLAGRTVNCRYHGKNRREIMQSRMLSTRAVGDAIASCTTPPRVWLQASTATIYAHRYDAANDEASGIIGGDESGIPSAWRFSNEVAARWEAAAMEHTDLNRTRRVLLRSAITFSPDAGGAFDTLLRLVRFGLGGTSGNGRQFVSWVHEYDFIRAIEELIANDSLSGPVNIAAPTPLPNAEFMKELRKAWGMPIGLPASPWMLEIGALLLQTETELVLKSRRVTGGKLAQAGFQFDYPDWTTAVRELCDRWRSRTAKR